MFASIKRIIAMQWRVVFYPFGGGVAIVLNKYGNTTRHIKGTMPYSQLELELAVIAQHIEDGTIPPDWWVEGPC